jgi:hypothetical protein
MTDALAAALEDNAELVEEIRGMAALLEEAAQVTTTDWLRTLSDNDGVFARENLTEVTAVCRAHAVANPLIRRGLNLRASYVWGGGVQIAARATGSRDGEQDVNTIVQAFLDTPGNALLEHDVNERSLGTDGQVFFALFTNPATGAVQVRRLPWDQVVEIITNPEDSSEPWLYLREWTVRTIDAGRTKYETRQAFYPAVGYRPAVRAKKLSIENREPIDVQWDAPVHHMAVNRLDGWQFGLGDAFAAIDWARAYSVFLEDWAKLVKALSMFAWRATSKASKTTGIAAKIATAGAAGTVGATATGSGDVTLEAIPKTGATIDSESGRPLAAMVAAALDVPVTMLLGDPGTTGARATAETLDRPTEDMAALRRAAWTETFTAIVGYVIDQAVKAPQGPLKGTIIRDPYTGREVYTLDGDTSRTLEVTWPPLDEIDPAAMVAAIVQADSTDTIPRLVVLRLLLQALRVDDVDEILEQVTDENGQFIDPQASAGQAAVDAFNAGQDPAAVLSRA